MKKNHEEDKEKPQEQQEQQAPADVSISAAELEALKQQAAKAQENWDKYVRLQADFDNARKRWERDREEFTRYANETVLCDLLNIIDDLERSVELSQQKHEDYTAFLKGVEMILAHVHDLLKKNKVCCMQSTGKCFDPHVHEALMQVERDDLPENTVVQELQKGYMIGDRILRTAKVQVSRKKNEEVKNG